MRPAAARWWMPLGFAVACGSIQPPNGSGPPANACSESVCSGYEQAGPAPACSAGVCLVAASLSNVIYVIDLAQDSFLVPGGTFVVPHDHLYDPPSDPTATTCVPLPCGHLPAGGEVSGSYFMAPSAQSPPMPGSQGVGFYLGNDSTAQGSGTTALPVVATYRMLDDPWGDDVVALGLPIGPVQAQSTIADSSPFPGPYGGPTFAFQTFLEPGTYERTLVPDPPFDAVFGPEVRSVAAPASFDSDIVTGFDATTEESGLGATLPTFEISRADGLEGWSAYLRDATTLQTISNVKPLAGTLAQGVFLASRRPPASSGMEQQDALTNAELVIAPPAGVPIPTGVFKAQGSEFASLYTYPPLAQPVTLTGNIFSAAGTPVAAELVFEALAITDPNGLNPSNFEFVGYASARPATPGGASAYSVVLPPGQYRVDVRPVATTSAVTITDMLVAAAPSLSQVDFPVEAMSAVTGTAKIADERLLSGATVEALPTQCFVPPPAADAGTAGLVTAPASSPSCLPRPSQVTTAADGSFALPLDPGSYLLRVRPADGTRLPWVTQAVTVPPVSDAGAPAAASVMFKVPAPVYAGLRLQDPMGNAIVNAIVRAFPIPTQAAPPPSAPAPAIELGEAITDVNGQFDLYIVSTPQ